MADIDDLAALEAEAAAAEAAVPVLSAEEQRRAEALARIERAKEATLSAARTRRANDLAPRVKAARAAGKAARPPYTVEGIDIAALVPEAEAASLPGAGTIIVRSPPPDAFTAALADIEAKERPTPAIYADLVCASTVEPKIGDVSSDETRASGITFRRFLEDNPGACLVIGGRVQRLGGLRVKETKRGSE